MSVPSGKKLLNIHLNRVEGDLEIHADIQDGAIRDVWSSGTMYRGFENIMAGRGTLDGLVITPRICGVCSLSHLTAAVEALEDVSGVHPPDNARRMRNLALMVEMIQSDIRQSILMFMVDFANRQFYREHTLVGEAHERYAPLSGISCMQTIRETKRLLEMVAILGGQWPHTSFMVPGGVTSSLGISETMKCNMILKHFQEWYENFVLGCSIQRWKEVTDAQDLNDWLQEKDNHQQGELGFFIRFSREAGLDGIGQGPERYLSFGGFPLPQNTSIQGPNNLLLPPGSARGTHISTLDPSMITEDISHAWYQQENTTAHPLEAETRPYASGYGWGKYSWGKAPRYKGEVVETGPLAEALVSNNPLFQDLVQIQGSSVLTRQLARLTRPARLLPVMQTWLNELEENLNNDFYQLTSAIPDGEGAGLIQAPRGALGHWVRVKDEKIQQYQIITPSTWNGSPRDETGAHGAWEQALLNTPLRDPENPVEAGHVIRSFDPCLVCSVHCVDNQKTTQRMVLGNNL